MGETKSENFSDLLKITEEKLLPIVLKLRDIIFKIDSKTYETVRLGERAATYGIGPKKMKEGYVYILPHKSWVNLGFYQGAILNDPNGVLEGTGKTMRHIKIHSVEEANNINVKELITCAFIERKNNGTT